MDEKTKQSLRDVGLDDEMIDNFESKGCSDEQALRGLQIARVAEEIAPVLMEVAAELAGGDPLTGSAGLRTAYAWVTAVMGLSDEDFEKSLECLRVQRANMLKACARMQERLSEALKDELVPDLSKEN